MISVFEHLEESEFNSFEDLLFQLSFAHVLKEAVALNFLVEQMNSLGNLDARGTGCVCRCIARVDVNIDRDVECTVGAGQAGSFSQERVQRCP